MLADKVREKLVELSRKMQNSEVHTLTRKSFGQPQYRKMGDKDETAPLPTLSGTIGDVELTVEFVPFAEGGYLMDIGINAKSPFRLVLTLEGKESKSLKFKGSSFMPVQEIEIGHKEFDDRYFIETLEEESVVNYLGDEEFRNMIDSLGDFDKLVFQTKYLKLTYFLENLEDLDIAWVQKNSETMAKIAKRIQ